MSVSAGSWNRNISNGWDLILLLLPLIQEFPSDTEDILKLDSEPEVLPPSPWTNQPPKSGLSLNTILKFFYSTVRIYPDR